MKLFYLHMLKDVDSFDFQSMLTVILCEGD